MGTKSKSLCLLAIILLQSLCLAVATKLPAKYRKSFEDSSRFREAHSTTNLPASVVALCADGKGMLAEPGQKWEATDVITNAKLPRNRLIWAATADPYYVVHYERGGRGHSFLILIVVFRKESANPQAALQVIGAKLKDYEAFAEALRAGKIDDLFTATQ